MRSLARLIYKSNLTIPPYTLPVYYYGLPDGKVYLIYARTYEINFEKSGLEFVFAIHKDFQYDFESYTIYYKKILEVGLSDFIETVEKPDQNIKIKKVYRNLNSYREARNLLNEKALKKITKLKKVPA